MADLITGYAWHKLPYIYATVSYSTSRPEGAVSAQVNTNITISMNVRSGYFFNWEVWCYVSVNGGPEELIILNYGQGNGNSPNTGTWSDSKSTTIVRDVEANTENIRIRFVCGQEIFYGRCEATGGPYTYDNTFSVGVPEYNPEVPPTNVSYGVVHTTSNTSNANQSSISAKPDEEIWFDWWGQLNGYPEKNEIDYFNVDINTVNDSNGASSISITDHYIQNTHLSLFTICKSFNVKVGGTLYFWVNTCTKGGAWLGRTYLGSVKIKKDGAIFIKDGSNKREVVAAYIKDSNGNRVKLSNIQIKDGSNKRKIDVYTTLYE